MKRLRLSLARPSFSLFLVTGRDEKLLDRLWQGLSLWVTERCASNRGFAECFTLNPIRFVRVYATGRAGREYGSVDGRCAPGNGRVCDDEELSVVDEHGVGVARHRSDVLIS